MRSPARSDTSLLHALFDATPLGVGLHAPDLTYLQVNPALAAINGVSAADHTGHRPSELLGPLGAAVEDQLREVLAGGEPIAVEVSGRTPATAGEEHHYLVQYFPVADEGGALEAVGAVVVDVSDRRAAEAESDRLRRRAEFLAASAETLASSLDWDATVRAVVEAAVPDLGDWCVCAVVEGDEVHLHALAHADPADAPRYDTVAARWPQPLAAAWPVPVAIRTGRPYVADVASGGDALAPVAALGAHSVLAVPLLTPTGVIGALGLLHTKPGRRHGPEDVETAQALADRAAVAIAHARAHDAAQQRLALLGALFDSAPVGIAFVDEELRYRRVNGRLAEINGTTAEAHLGRVPTDVLGAAAGAPVEDILRTVLADGAREGEVSTADGRHFLAAFSPVEDARQRLGVTGIIVDITARKRAEARERLLGRVGEALDAELDPRAAAQRLCELVAEELGGACEVALAGGARLRAGDAAGGTGERLHAPLATRGRTLGTLTVTAGEQPLHPGDARLLADLGDRAALSLDNLALYAGHKAIASTLQGRLLPRRIPDVTGVEVATRYRAAGEHNEVGGDFYDVFRGPDGAWTALVGDVAGKGAEAAALTASIRQIVRTGTRWCDSASELLAVVNDELIQDTDARTCTLAHAVLEDRPDGLHVAVTLAGHPLPLVLRAGGRVETLGAPGTLLGGLRTIEVVTETTVLASGDLLLLYTDGMVEVGRGRRAGELLDLAAVLEACAGGDAAEVVGRVEEAAVRAADGTPPDDIALVCLRRR